ncbi:type VI secretion system baseplate subunit TssE [Chitinispirillales bacterium ANBcel5]|uniref:type VI secretion system baseplate subunit TssE n=1 Tax=Cellulosispirillum alkaliphilum TaxID=3039283 RepID=UPI002A53F406|nr:type VI secretion system baseplate subunit TssE [Chitinispirillales bacterium ANBcel5]
MKQGLFESLTGEFLDGTPVDDVAQGQKMTKSIMDHLSRLFNTRCGSIPHLPDYGLPDISEMYRKMPVGTHTLRQAIRKTVEKYEPRLKNIRVEPQQSKDKHARIVFILSAKMKNNGAPVRFQTTFSASAPSKIIPWKKMD